MMTAQENRKINPFNFLNKKPMKKAIANEFAACELIKEYSPPQSLTNLMFSIMSDW